MWCSGVAFAFLAILSIANARAAGLREEKGIEYQPLPIRQYLDVVLPEGAGPFPAVVVLHGGGLHGGSRSDVGDFCRHLAESGLAAAAVDYRMPPQQLFPAPLNDVKSAIRWLRANARRLSLDPERIGAVGFDAGGYLAVFAALTGATPEFEGIGPRATYSSRIHCAVAVDPLLAPEDMEEQVHFSFVGGAPGSSLTVEHRANTLNWITPDAAPVLLLGHMPPSAKQFVERMTQASVETAIAAQNGAPGEMQNRAISFFQQHLKTQPQTRIVVADHGPGAEVILMDWPSGREIWRAPNNRGHDVQALENGDFLVTLEEEGAVVEYDPRQPADGNIVWEYGPAEGLKLTISAERLSNGNTVIADTGSGKLVEIAPGGQVVWQYVNPDLAGNRMRHCRRTSSGTTLIAVEAASKIIEVDRAGKIVWSWTAPGGKSRRPYQAKRLPNGNTIVSLMNPGEVVEVNPAGEVVRSVGGSGPVRIGWASGFDLLPNGNLIVGDYTGQRLIEIDRSGKAVHELQMAHRPATVAVAPLSK
jgi:acetyl esterase/lipase